MISRLRRMFQRKHAPLPTTLLRFGRPLVLFQSDDWGRVGVRDREGWEELRAGGLNLGEKPYDFYSLETADDLQALSDTLKKHRDSVGRNPCVGMNFIMANVDFPRAISCSEAAAGYIPLLPLTDGFPEPWRRPGLLEAYQQGIRARLFYPALHGLTHFCVPAMAREIGVDGERRRLLHTLWQAGTPYIHWRMPWVGYEYWDASLPMDQRFLPLEKQRMAIRRAAEIYRALFASVPLSACAPGYRANEDTKTAWHEAGVRLVQRGPGERHAPSIDSNGMLHTCRNVEIEPATQRSQLEEVVKQANDCLASGMPTVVSTHSINFHSTIRDFRASTLAMLDVFLSALEKRWPDLLYVHDGDLWQIATVGFFAGESEKIKVGTTLTRSDR